MTNKLTHYQKMDRLRSLYVRHCEKFGKLNKERYLYQELRNGCKKYIEKISKKDHLGDMLKIILDK